MNKHRQASDCNLVQGEYVSMVMVHVPGAGYLMHIIYGSLFLLRFKFTGDSFTVTPFILNRSSNYAPEYQIFFQLLKFYSIIIIISSSSCSSSIVIIINTINIIIIIIIILAWPFGACEDVTGDFG